MAIVPFRTETVREEDRSRGRDAGCEDSDSRLGCGEDGAVESAACKVLEAAIEDFDDPSEVDACCAVLGCRTKLNEIDYVLADGLVEGICVYVRLTLSLAQRQV